MDTKKFEKALKAGFEIEYGEDSILEESGLYSLAYTTNETNTLDYDLKFDVNSMEMIWYIDMNIVHKEKYTEDEIISFLESGDIFEFIYEHCYDTEGDS